MKTGILAVLVSAVALSGCMHGGHRCAMRDDGIVDSEGMMGAPGGMRGMHEKMTKSWPTVRVDGPAGAHVKMERGVFGDGIDVRAPFQGQFQPTGNVLLTGYPLELELDATAAQHYGHRGATTIYGRMIVGEAREKRGVLVLAPSECALKALMAGDLDELRIRADELPRADLACEAAKEAVPHDAAPMSGQPGATCMHGAGGCPFSAGGPHARGGCPHAGHASGGCGGSHPHGGGAWLVLRTTKF